VLFYKKSRHFLFTDILLFISSLFIFCFFHLHPVFAFNLGLIEPNNLKQNISQWIILDARPQNEWLAGHIPGALSFSWKDFTRKDEKGTPYRVWPPSELAKALGNMGIDENKPIVVYGDADESWGGEGWTCWVLSWIGHKGPIRLLNGGIQNWKQHSFPLKEGAEKLAAISRVQYKYTLDESLIIHEEEILRKRSSIVLVDTRSTLEWFIEKIEGAAHIPWDDFFTGKNHQPLSSDQLKYLLSKKGVDTNKTIVYYCSGGIRSAYAWMVHQLAGLPNAINYEGGYEAWKRHK
jgi:thiosulfate/3-mercaptopyruvate sulfurtransferase